MDTSTFRFLPVLLLAFAITGCAEPVPLPSTPPQPQPEPEIPSVDKVRALVHDSYPDACARLAFLDDPAYKTLMAFGDRVFPAYEVILADPTTQSDDFWWTSFIITRLQTDRRRFIPILLRRMAPDAMIPDDAKGPFGPLSKTLPAARDSIRRSAVRVLGEIGDTRDTDALIPLLSEDEPLLSEAEPAVIDSGKVRYRAAEALAKIGGKRDLDAMDAWLKSDSYKNDAYYRERVKKCRDELEKRLKDNPIPKDLTN